MIIVRKCPACDEMHSEEWFESCRPDLILTETKLGEEEERKKIIKNVVDNKNYETLCKCGLLAYWDHAPEKLIEKHWEKLKTELEELKMSEEEITLEGIKKANPYVDIGIGKVATFVVEKYTKNSEDSESKFNLTTTKDGNLGYHNVLYTTDGKKLTVGSFPMKIQLEKAFKEAGKINGLKLTLNHPARGEFTYELHLDSE